MSAQPIPYIEDIHPSSYITNESGEKTSVVLPIEAFRAMQEAIREIQELAEDYELGQLVLERRSQKDQAIRVSLEEEEKNLRQLLQTSKDTTDYLLSSPKNAKLLEQSIAELEAGNGIRHELIEP